MLAACSWEEQSTSVTTAYLRPPMNSKTTSLLTTATTNVE